MSNIKPSPLIGTLTAYATPMSETPVDLFLNGNEGAPPPAQVLDAVKRGGPEAVRRYPDESALSRRIASMLDIPLERLLITAGADDGLGRVLRAMLAPGRELILPVPTFEMIPRYAKLTGATIKEVYWPIAPMPVDEIIRNKSDKTALVSVVTPNSPMGQVATEADLKRLSEAFPEALILVDLAYTDFAETDLTPVALSLPNTVITRSLSKAWGLAGLRVGFAAGPKEVIGWLKTAGHPYCVSSLSLAVADDRLRTGVSEVADFVQEVRKQRKTLSDTLRHLGAETAESEGNFVFVRFTDALWVRDAMAGLGIAVRAFPGQSYLDGGVRITVPGNRSQLDRLMHTLKTVLAPEALLLDIDDTLADVTASYRQATVATAAAFGVTIDFNDITAAKAEGDANNDWELSCRLINDAGVTASLEAVTKTFEALYQGDGTRPGYKEKETLLCDTDLLERLAKRIPLGVVTGRPRRDAEEFLEKMKIAHLFGAVITMNDAPLKPSPAPMRLALERLGVTRAWMVGDTPDDIRSARNAGVLPLGVCAPADDPAVARRALTRAGAGRVLADLDELEKRLP